MRIPLVKASFLIVSDVKIGIFVTHDFALASVALQVFDPAAEFAPFPFIVCIRVISDHV